MIGGEGAAGLAVWAPTVKLNSNMDNQTKENDLRLKAVIGRIICCKDKEKRKEKNHLYTIYARIYIFLKFSNRRQREPHTSQIKVSLLIIKLEELILTLLPVKLFGI